MKKVIIAIAVAFSAMAQSAYAEGAQIVAAEVVTVKNDPHTYVVNWISRPENVPVSISLSESFEKALDSRAAVLIAEQFTGNQITYYHKHGRAYFTIKPEGAPPFVVASRVLPLQGGRNFRDLGGYKTEDGRTVKWGKLYRSGFLHDLTDADYDYIDDLNIKTVVDFRTTEERHSEPTQWRDAATEFLSWDYSMDASGFFRDRFSKADLSVKDSAAAMAALYPAMLEEHKDRYSALFKRLLVNDAPLTFHCTAGKDRTGIAAALLLTALGVSRETVIADYAMTETVLDYSKMIAASKDSASDKHNPNAFLASLPQEVVWPLMRSDPAYIRAAIAEMEEQHGSVLGYIETELGVSNQDIQRLRARLLQ